MLIGNPISKYEPLTKVKTILKQKQYAYYIISNYKDVKYPRE